MKTNQGLFRALSLFRLLIGTFYLLWYLSLKFFWFRHCLVRMSQCRCVGRHGCCTSHSS